MQLLVLMLSRAGKTNPLTPLADAYKLKRVTTPDDKLLRWRFDGTVRATRFRAVIRAEMPGRGGCCAARAISVLVADEEVSEFRHAVQLKASILGQSYQF